MQRRKRTFVQAAAKNESRMTEKRDKAPISCTITNGRFLRAARAAKSRKAGSGPSLKTRMRPSLSSKRTFTTTTSVRSKDKLPKDRAEAHPARTCVRFFLEHHLRWPYPHGRQAKWGMSDERKIMNEEFNMSMRKFLKQVGVTSQQAIEAAMRNAGSGATAGKSFDAKMVLTGLTCRVWLAR